MQEKKKENQQNNSFKTDNNNENLEQQENNFFESNQNNKAESGDNRQGGFKKIYLVELFFIFPILIVADILDIFSLTGVGAILSWAMDIVTTGIITMWLWWKGKKVEWNLVANLVEFIPIIDLLPIRTTTMIILLIMDSKKEKQL